MNTPSRVLTLATLAAAAACALEVGDDPERQRDAIGSSSDATSDDEPSLRSEPDPVDAARHAADCHDCEVLHAHTVRLPETGRTLHAAKLRSPDGELLAVTVDEDGEAVDEPELLARERAAVVARHGKVTPELAARLTELGKHDSMWIWIWTAVPVEYPRKEDLLASPSLLAQHEERVATALAAASQPVRARLRELGAEVHDDGTAHPLIRARVPATAIRELAELPTVAIVGFDDYPGQELACSPPGDPLDPACHSWFGTLRADAAHAYFGSGSGDRICVKEGSQPADYTHLSVAGIASPGGYGDTHTQGSVGLIQNTDVPDNAVAPAASLYVANWDGFVGAGGVDGWCRSNNVRSVNFSWTWSTAAPHAEDATGWAQDWVAKNSPYMLYVAAAGNNGGGPVATGSHYVMNGNYNGLIVGGSDDQGDTDRNNDVFDVYTGWGNLTTTHGDHELPHVVAPSYGAAVAGTWTNASSSASPMVAGVAALAAGRDHATFDAWPEMKRAVVIATATGKLDVPILGALPGASDLRSGAGLVDAFQAADLGNPADWAPPNSSMRGAGRHARTLSFAGDFDAGGALKDQYNIFIPGSCSSARLRTVIAWDATAGCDVNGENCTGSTLDGDLDLMLYPSSSYPPAPSGPAVCTSSSYDSSWEICDIPVVCGQEYVAKVKKFSTSAPNTYFGIAWYTYPG
jgi:hypothetical protein